MLRLLAKPVTLALAAKTKDRVAKVSAKLGRSPKLAVVLVGDNPASVIYTSKKGEAAVQCGMAHETVRFPESATPEEVREAILSLNRDPSVDGILLQRPLPKGFREEEVVYWISPDKDVDAFHPENAGRLVLGLPCFKPCTPSGVMEILRHYQIPVSGKSACVIGRSSIVGKPMAALLLQADATVFHCHSKTPNLPAIAAGSDILVVAAGKPGLVDEAFVKMGATVIDVGIHRLSDGKVVGDVDYESASKKAGAITPVPGGVGPMTIAILLENTVYSAEKTASRHRP